MKATSRRTLGCALAVCALGTLGCNQSLFDSNPDGRQDGGSADAGADAAPTASCPEPCAGDAFAEFASSQGGTNGRWTYLAEDGSRPNGADYTQLTFDARDGLGAWIAGPTGPAIAKCDGSSASACAGVDGFVLLFPGSDGGTVPALSFRPEESASYRVSGTFRAADGSPADVAARFLLSRNSKHDASIVQTLRTSTADGAVDGVVTAIEGDELILSLEVADATPIAFRLFFTRIDSGADAFPGSCQLTVRFDDGVEESCRSLAVTDLNDGIGPPGMSVEGPGPSSRLGTSRTLAEGQFLKLGNSAMNYTGDFTIQFWTQTPEPLPSFDSTPIADWNTAVKGGVALFFDDDSTILDFCYMSHGGAVEIEACSRGVRPLDGEFHFWRIVRSTAEGTLRLCLDGVENVQVQIPGTDNMTGDEPPHIGRNVTYNPAYYGGQIDDIRIFSAALPCTTTAGF